MPPRVYDYDLIIKTYDELKDVAKVSQKLSIPWRTCYDVVNRDPDVLPYSPGTVPTEMIQKIIETYSVLRNMNAVAKELKVTRQVAQSIIYRYVENVCPRCKTSKLKPHQDVCAECLEKNATRVKSARKEKQRLGLCQYCDQPYDPPSRTLCAKHRLRRIDEQRTSKKNDKRKANGIDASLLKLYNIKKSYGANGLRCYNESDGRCFVCNRQQGEVVIHIHHVNCNEKDNSFENLMCLCYDHHVALHATIRGPHLQKFMELIRTKYLPISPGADPHRK